MFPVRMPACVAHFVAHLVAKKDRDFADALHLRCRHPSFHHGSSRAFVGRLHHGWRWGDTTCRNSCSNLSHYM